MCYLHLLVRVRLRHPLTFPFCTPLPSPRPTSPILITPDPLRSDAARRVPFRLRISYYFPPPHIIATPFVLVTFVLE